MCLVPCLFWKYLNHYVQLHRLSSAWTNGNIVYYFSSSLLETDSDCLLLSLWSSVPTNYSVIFNQLINYFRIFDNIVAPPSPLPELKTFCCDFITSLPVFCPFAIWLCPFFPVSPLFFSSLWFPRWWPFTHPHSTAFSCTISSSSLIPNHYCARWAAMLFNEPKTFASTGPPYYVDLHVNAGECPANLFIKTN